MVDGDGRRAVSARTSLALLALGALALAPGLLLGPPDAKGTAGALRVLAGEVPYRDFWSMYAPGQFWAQALVFRAFGVSYLAQGIACVLVQALAGVVWHRLLVASGAGRRLALALWGVLVVALWRIAPELTSYPPALLLGLAGLSLVARSHRGGSGGALFAAGLAFGAAAVFKHDVAAYFAAAACGSLALRRALPPEPPRAWLAPVRAVGLVATGCLVAAGPAIGWLAARAGADAWRDLVVFPATDFPLLRAEAYPGLLPDPAPFRALLGVRTAAGRADGRPSGGDPGADAATDRASSTAGTPSASPPDDGAGARAGDEPELDLPRRLHAAGDELRAWSLTQLPVVVFALGLAVLLARRHVAEPAAQATALMALCGLPFFYAAAHVQQNTHLDSMAVLSLLLLALGAAGARGVLARAALALGIALYSGSFLLEAGMRMGELAVSWSSARPLPFPAARGLRFRDPRRTDAYEELGTFVRERVPPGERIFAGVDRHDAIVGNDQNFYVLADRLPATRYGELHPGVVDRADVQREMIADLERRGTRCAIVWRFRFGDPERRIAERRAALPDVGADLLDRYLEQEFDEVLRSGRYSVLWRKGAPGGGER